MLRQRTKKYGKGMKETKMRVYEGEELKRQEKGRQMGEERGLGNEERS